MSRGWSFALCARGHSTAARSSILMERSPPSHRGAADAPVSGHDDSGARQTDPVAGVVCKSGSADRKQPRTTMVIDTIMNAPTAVTWAHRRASLCPTYSKPFDLLVRGNETGEWRREGGSSRKAMRQRRGA